MKEIFNKFISLVNEAKLLIGTIGVVLASLMGGYGVVTEYFVTKAYAKELESNIQQMVKSVQTQTQQNSIMIIELKLSDYERRVEKGEKLTPTEQRQYNRLLIEYNNFVK